MEKKKKKESLKTWSTKWKCQNQPSTEILGHILTDDEKVIPKTEGRLEQ